MTRLDWSNAFRDYSVGVDRGVLYFAQNEAVVWDGLVSVSEEGQSGNARPMYFEGVLFNLRQEVSDYTAKIEAFTYPYFLEDAILALTDTRTLVGLKADNEPFAFSYRTMTAAGYEIHIVYNIVATMDNVSHRTLAEEIELEPFSFTFHTTPKAIDIAKPTSHFIIDTARANENAVFEIEKLLYGSDTTSPRLPSVSTLIDIFSANP